MKPRDFLNFFKTKSGKLVLFVAIFGGGLMIFSVLRGKSRSPEDIAVAPARTNMTDKAQVVQSVELPMQPFRPPTPKPEPLPVVKTNEAPKVVIEPRPQEAKAPPLPPISLFPDSATETADQKTVSSIYAPFGRLISCETIVTVDSASIQTPIIGLVTENIYHAGKLVIPAGTEVHGTAQTDRHRERIASGNNWTLVWQGGEELHLKAVALDREFSGDQEGWGITDGSAGLRGRVLKSDDLAEIKLFAATFLSGVAGALTEKQQTVFGPINSPTLNNAPFEGVQKVIDTYAQRIFDAIQKDGFYVRVASGKQFYLYVLQTIDRAEAEIGGSEKPFVDDTATGAEKLNARATFTAIPPTFPSTSTPIKP
jgi:Bacterial conjugation TrbI-like protein